MKQATIDRSLVHADGPLKLGDILMFDEELGRYVRVPFKDAPVDVQFTALIARAARGALS